MALNDTTVKFEIWDTAGQERYHSLAPMYYRGAAAAIVVYDITSPDSFARAKSWVRELQRQGNPNIVIALAGNKSDLASKRKVEPDEARAYAEENNIMFMETSAKTASNVNELFVQIGMPRHSSPTSFAPVATCAAITIRTKRASPSILCQSCVPRPNARQHTPRTGSVAREFGAARESSQENFRYVLGVDRR